MRLRLSLWRPNRKQLYRCDIMRPSQVMMTVPSWSSYPSVSCVGSQCCVDSRQVVSLWCKIPPHLNVAQLYETPASIAMTTCVVGAVPSLFEFDEGERERSIAMAAVTCLEQCPNS